MLVIGLTGGIASGKSTVERLFSTLGTTVIDADAIAAQTLQPGQPGLTQTVAAFGADILNTQGRLDRSRMRQRIFADAAARKRLDAIIHPLVAEQMQQRLDGLAEAYAILSVPLLLESGQMRLVDRILVVDLPENLQIERLMARDHCDEHSAGAILAAQTDRSSRRRAADDLIDNSGPRQQLPPQVERLHRLYLTLARTPPP